MVALSDLGTSRHSNEDYFGFWEEGGLVVVCDGMGGHKAGEMASRLAVETIKDAYLEIDVQQVEDLAPDVPPSFRKTGRLLVGAIRLANRRLFQQAQKSPHLKGMGTTVVTLALREGIAFISHVGDSRAYRFRKGHLEQLTTDHSWVNELIQDKEIREEEVPLFEGKNVITRAVGLDPQVKIDLRMEPIQKGDLFLLCTDGLTDALSNEIITQILRENSHNLEQVAFRLIQMAKQKNGSDNITVALARVEGLPKQGEIAAVRPTSVTIKEENEHIVSLENRLLKQFYQKREKSFKPRLRIKWPSIWWNMRKSLAGLLPFRAFLR